MLIVVVIGMVSDLQNKHISAHSFYPGTEDLEYAVDIR